MQTTKRNDGVVVIRPQDAIPTRQGLPAFVGVAAGTAGATGICMNIVEIPAGAAAEPHAHAGFETAIYLLEGSVETRWGHALEHRTVTKPGDFLYIAAGVSPAGEPRRHHRSRGRRPQHGLRAGERGAARRRRLISVRGPRRGRARRSRARPARGSRTRPRPRAGRA